MPEYEVRLYYSTYRTLNVEAENAAVALVKARKKLLSAYDEAEIIANLLRWSEADDVEPCKSESESGA